VGVFAYGLFYSGVYCAYFGLYWYFVSLVCLFIALGGRLVDVKENPCNEGLLIF
jgi:hypothetical protein